MINGAALFVLMRIIMGAYEMRGIDKAISKARKMAPELFLKTHERAEKDGYPFENHRVQTEDGYILGVHRLRGTNGSPPVLLQHGLGTTSDSWLCFGNRSLAYQLVKSGFDVWMGNNRGNLYSREHTSMQATDPEFWKFSWHEMGVYDQPATIDYILKTTGQDRLFYIVYSMGNSMAYVLLSMKPEYNERMRQVVCMSPAAFFKHVASKTALNMHKNWKIIRKHLNSRPTYEMLPYSEEVNACFYLLCHNQPFIGRMYESVVTDTFGESKGLSRDDLPLVEVTLSGGHSGYTVWHYIQLIESGKFQQFDYGAEENQSRYGSSTPPEYDLTKVTAPVAIHYGETDSLITTKDVQHLSTILPNVTELRKVPSDYFSHLDFITHTNLNELLNEHIVESLKNK